MDGANNFVLITKINQGIIMINIIRQFKILSLLLIFTFMNVKPITVTVTNTNNSGPGSLRDAINQVNVSVDPSNTINFNIMGAGPAPVLINTNSSLPPITKQVTLDGYTQPGSQVNTATNGTTNAIPGIELNGQGLNLSSGLILSAPNCIVRGFVIDQFADRGILVQSDGNRISGNFIGTDPTGMIISRNQTGIYVSGDSNSIGGPNPADKNIIGGCLAVFGNRVLSNASLFLTGSNNIINGNLIGVNALGNEILGQSNFGIALSGGSNNNIIGGTTGNNVISGQGLYGIIVNSAEALPTVTGTLLTKPSDPIQRSPGSSSVGEGPDKAIDQNLTTDYFNTPVNGIVTANSMQIDEVQFLTSDNTPILTPTTGPNPSTITASPGNSPGAEQVQNAIDENLNTKYLNFCQGLNTSQCTQQGPSPSTCGLNAPYPTGFIVTPPASNSSLVATKMQLTSANDAPTRDPKVVQLSGSNASVAPAWCDDAAWEANILGTVSYNFNNQRHFTITQPLTNPGAFMHYRWKVLEINQGQFEASQGFMVQPSVQSPSIVTGMNVTNARDGFSARNPITINLYGSNATFDLTTNDQPTVEANWNSPAWEFITTKTLTWTAQVQTQGFVFENMKAYTFYKWEVTQVQSGVEMEVIEVGLYADAQLVPLLPANRIEGNFIGTDVTGTKALGNMVGILLTSNTNDTVIHNNVISGNRFDGVQVGFSIRAKPGVVNDSPLNTQITGNKIGTDVTGTLPLGNGYNNPIKGLKGDGIKVLGAIDTRIGIDPAAPLLSDVNIISGNAGNGIRLISGALGTSIKGNMIGVDVAGTQPLGNGRNGIQLRTDPDLVPTTETIIGGSTAEERNIIASNQANGIEIRPYSPFNTITNNYIGSSAVNGNIFLPNFAEFGNVQNGVLVDNSTDILINNNLIVNNGLEGVALVNNANNNTVQSNNIHDNGTDGVTIKDSSCNLVGGDNNNACSANCDLGLGNTIEHNGGFGVAVVQKDGIAVDNAIVGNDISGNRKDGIGLVGCK